MRLVQFRDRRGPRGVAVVREDGVARRLDEAETTYELALEAIETGTSLVDLTSQRLAGEVVDLDAAEREGRLLPPLEHPVPTRCWITGTGLTHAGSAEARDRMHASLTGPAAETDSYKLFRWGLERGKAPGVGVQPEWFFRGNGSTLVGSGQPLPLPDFALEGGEEPEVVGLYVIDDDGTPCRLGWALGNDFTDHAMEKKNYLYLAHSKLRVSAVGPEMRLGTLPTAVEGISRILRDGGVLWERPFITGEDNMTHTVANVEHHHFKYPMHRRPGDVHMHFFGTSTVSSADGVMAQPGDVFEIVSPLFGRPLRNRLERVSGCAPAVRVL